MTNDEKIQHWINLSDYDMETAEAMLQTKRFLYVGFMCHQVVEKIFKACYAKLKENSPPFTHDLEYIALKGGFYEILSEEQKDFIVELNPLNVEARYAEYKEEISRRLTPAKCAGLLEQTAKILQWTKETILSVK
jgi:HEPN domain-containing protein